MTMHKTTLGLTLLLFLKVFCVSLAEEAKPPLISAWEKFFAIRFHRVTLQNVDIPLAFLALALEADFNCGLEPRPEDDMIFGGSGEKAHKVSINLRDASMNQVLQALRSRDLGHYEWIWDPQGRALNVFPVPRPAPPEEKEIYPPRWSSVVLPSFSLECACYTEAMKKLLSYPALKGFNVSFDASGSYSVDCGKGEHSFLGEDDDPIRLTLEAELRKGWTVRQWLNFIHEKVSVLSRRIWFAQPKGRLISVGWVDKYPVPKGSVILIEPVEEPVEETPKPLKP